jgi:hypothetical protein
MPGVRGVTFQVNGFLISRQPGTMSFGHLTENIAISFPVAESLSMFTILSMAFKATEEKKVFRKHAANSGSKGRSPGYDPLV